MQTIWKYKLSVTDEQIIEVPYGEEFLYVDVQNGIPCLWAIVYPHNPIFKKKIRIFGTGHSIKKDSANMWYLGSFQLYDETFVGHVFVDK